MSLICLKFPLGYLRRATNKPMMPISTPTSDGGLVARVASQYGPQSAAPRPFDFNQSSDSTNRVSICFCPLRCAMPAWIIKTEAYDPDRALWIVEDQRNKGFDAWIEDENGAAVDEQSLKMNGRVATKRTLLDRLMGPLFIAAWVVAGFFVVYLIGLWIDHY
jgi:hypothetical protein